MGLPRLLLHRLRLDADERARRRLHPHHDLPAPVPGFMEDVPYSVAVVELDEGPRMLTSITGCEAKDVHVGMAVEVAFEDATDEITLYKFKPAA